MKISSAALLLLLSAPAFGAVPAGDHPGFMTPAVREALLLIQEAMPRWATVYMRIYSTAGPFLDIQESILRISLSGHKDGDGHFRFSGYADSRSLSFTADPRGPQRSDGYSFWGGGVNLTLWPSASGYQVWGNIDDKNLNLALNRFGEKNFNIWHTGGGATNLSASAYGQDVTINGSVDLSQFDKTSLAVLGAVVSVINATEPAPPQPR